MNCEMAQQRLDEWLDGELDAAEAAEVAAHVEACEACAAERDAQQRLMSRLAALPTERQPSRDLWPDIAARLEPRTRNARRPWMIAIAASFLLAGVFFAGMLADRVTQEQDSMDTELAAVDRIPEGSERAAARRLLPRAQVELVSGSSNRETEDVMLQNLLIVNLAIRQVEQAVEAEPDNPELRQLLTSLYEQENRLLRRAERLAGSSNTTKRIGI
ncbi:MAG: zf-HC2 domain-containing protein [Gammaproteobacteria bacterium]|nr:zf-HC2 domain-containing protein [Gammaproteobacteria bacterium]